MGRLKQLFSDSDRDILSIYFTAGFPRRDDTREIINELAKASADMIEIGIPFSDPVADGPTIQQSNMAALRNGITLELIFTQIADIRDEVDIPLILMGYLNPVMQFGIERFCQMAEKAGIDGLILPDLPLMEYQQEYRDLFNKHGLSNIFLITPQTSEARIRELDEESQAFIYAVSTSSTTGKTDGFGQAQLSYFDRIAAMNLKNPVLVGFGISDHTSFRTVADRLHGGIIGSAFIKALQQDGDLTENIHAFVSKIRGGVGVS